MEILDPDLWNDDGTPKKPTQEYMQSLDEAQVSESYLSYVRAQAEAKANTPASLGDVVHFWDGEHCRAALVTETGSFDHDCTLRVFVPNEPEQWWHVGHDEGKSDDSWHWAESER